jgi:CheY-like chemotaxis protein
MPNWATSKIVITSTPENLKEIREQLSKPYKYPDSEEQMAGEFLLWNIVSPTDLYTYTGKDVEAFAEIAKNNPDLTDKRSPEEKMQAFTEEMASGEWLEKLRESIATGMGWYEWNIRNWGTKWEISEDKCEVLAESETSITYRVETAWNSPLEALDKLAEQHPLAMITLDGIDESDCWALSALWLDGERKMDGDLEITHDVHMSLLGYCWACDGNDPDYADDRITQGCPDEQA